MQIFVVDDSKLARASLIKLLKEYFPGVILKEASNGQEVLDLLEFITPDAIFLDLTMPIMNGYELLEVLHNKSSTIPVYVLTADIQKTSHEKVIKLGAKNTIHKPVTLEKIQGILLAIKEGQ